MALSAKTLAAVQHYGPTVDSIAAQYHLSGSALLAKLVQGESGDSGTAVSSAGARAWTQFTPGSRQIAIDKYGIDPWADVDQAVHAASLHLRGKINGSTGLKGYNPGSPTYTSYILGQKVGNVSGGVRPASTPAAPGTTTPAAAAPSGSGQQAAPSFSDPGQAGDFTGLLGQLLGGQQQQAPQSQAVAPPQFSARAPMPQGFQAATPQAVQAPGQTDRVGGALGLLDALRGTDPASAQQSAADATGVPQGPVALTVAKQRAAVKTAGGVISPNARAGDPVVSSKQTVGGEHETMGLAGYPAHDYFAPAGTHAVAPVGGTVIRLSGHDPADGLTNGPHGPLGYSVYIRGTDGRTYYLTHMGSRNVKAGQKVAQGQILGTVADYDKYGTPSHIHMGISG